MSRSIQIFLIIGISSFILLFPAYLRYTNLSEINLFPTDLSFENPDQDDDVNSSQHESDGFSTGIDPIPSFPETNLLRQPDLFSHKIASTYQSNSILRC